ncbi:NACHT domain-containing protein [Labilibaculum euxinus]|uniref:ATP-binding protein n=1 Tax=Labilibaculum euxinus TaxID=2686357 RepID=A0A7M4D8L4_9BACT|nr:hypothetical protein [Labilibaculum euxinus]MUP38993.1 hypothetical protein [Labilibaculum euxinus]MVB08198.1 hypothetical protein [Labilibaculum euxinus]
MNWSKFLTYSNNYQTAFETLCNQLFERYLRRNYNSKLDAFRVINGSGGDGGIEAYGKLNTDDIIAVQAKWFPTTMSDNQLSQIDKSITTALKLRPQIKEYIICIPHNVNSLKIGRGNKPIKNHEENKINQLINKFSISHSNLKLTWWFDNEILTELQQKENDGILKFWFHHEIITMDYLNNQFNIQKKGWLNERYVPELHGQGMINKEYQKLCFSSEYKKEVLQHIFEIRKELYSCISLIRKFLPLNHQKPSQNIELKKAKNNLNQYNKEFKKIEEEIKIGCNIYNHDKIEEFSLWEIKLELENIVPDNLQKNILPKLISTLDEIHGTFLPQFVSQIITNCNRGISLILGEPGTGKTHGLTNCVESHLNNNTPALLIQAKSTPSNNWTEILANTLEITSWRKDEILTALEAQSIINDVKYHKSNNQGSSLTSPSINSKVLICVDGLEEDIDNVNKWYERIRESEELVKQYPRIKFMFSARRYFYNNTLVPDRGIFEDIFLPREGDISVREIARKYFSKEHFNIRVDSYDLINNIDSLFALRLFCEHYKGHSLNSSSKIISATADLLNLKINKINEELVSFINNQIGQTRNPILEALDAICNHFYSNSELDHEILVSSIELRVNQYLSHQQIDILIDYLVNNGILIRSERLDQTSVLKRKKYYYHITYQSIIEHIITAQLIKQISEDSLNQIPNILHRGMCKPIEFSKHDDLNPFTPPPNQRIIQDIVNYAFVNLGKLIGEDNYLTNGFEKEEIFKMQMEALRNAPQELAMQYESRVKSMFFDNYKNRFKLLKYLIEPSCYSSNSTFGSLFLHSILISFKSSFERDKIWSGLDKYEMREFNKDESNYYIQWNLDDIFDPYGMSKPTLSDWDLYDQSPLLFAWGLSSINYKLRQNLRIALTGWAIKQPGEFYKLLKTVFNCNDPQIQEELALITLGLASRLKAKNQIKKLAKWSLKTIFKNLSIYRNSFVRHGFRAIVERALQYDLISEEEVNLARPKQNSQINLLPILPNTKIESDEYYPITHDLAWYVIQKSYKPFLEYPSQSDNNIKDCDCIEAQKLLNNYRQTFEKDNLYAHEWALSVAITYIKSLGFNRTTGNGYTQASHGSKSSIFTYEEKYTWLAVHYLQGYLSDYIPIKNHTDERQFLSHYTQITDIPNPADSIRGLDQIFKDYKAKKNWIIKEPLTDEIDSSIPIADSITKNINEEPNIDIINWISFESKDFNRKDNKTWLSLYNYTSLLDSKQTCYSSFLTKACFLNSEELNCLIQNIKNDVITNLDGLNCTPDTSTYSSPSDIIWMSWIKELNAYSEFYQENILEKSELFHSLTEITQELFDEEKTIMLPSKKVRDLLGIVDYKNHEFKDLTKNTIAFNYEISEGSFRDKQNLLLIDKEKLMNALQEQNLTIVWFVQLFKRINVHNKDLPRVDKRQKTRKYFCWLDGDKLKNLKFWDETYSNHRDKVYQKSK